MAEVAGIFVSHAHEDHAWCRTFVEIMRTAGAAVWYDEHNLGYGASAEEVDRELKACPVYIIILSPASVTKSWIRREMDAAISLRDRNAERVIVPVVAEQAEIPIQWWNYQRVCGPGDTAISVTEAARRVGGMLGMVPAEGLAATALPERGETAAEATLRGNGLYAQNRYQKALSAYEKALALDPKADDTWIQKGNVLYDLERPAEALQAYEQALVLDPQNANVWNNKGNAWAVLERPAEALSAYEQALTLDPQAADVWNNKGTVLQGLQRPEEALEAYEQALALDPEYDVAWYNKATVLQDLDRSEEALEAYEQALTLAPGDPDIWNNMIDVLTQLGRTAEAQEAVRDRDVALRSR